VPDASGKLTAAEKQLAIDWINRHWRGRSQACPICGNTNWTLADHLVQPTTVGAQNALILGGTSYPVVMIISPTCGYTMLFNAVIMGLVPQAHPPTVPPEEDENEPE
jgi:predicted nucleic-acid-binding Zn-ribbon protein